jgi:hypothetical protein
MPETVILNANNIIRLKQDHLPIILIILSVFFKIIGFIDFPFIMMLTSGIFVGWIYLRFFQKHKNGTKGDSSSTFVFARLNIIYFKIIIILLILYYSFFPSQFQPFIAIISNTIFNLLVKINICKKPVMRYNVITSSNQSQITINLP